MGRRMTLRAGHCTVCDARIWRTVTHGRTGKEDLTYPRPDSVYATVQVAGRPPSPGAGYCAAHAPAVGDRGPTLPAGPSTVIGVEPAAVRHAYWYTPRFGRHLQAWLRDYCELSEGEQATVYEQWERDRGAVEAVHG